MSDIPPSAVERIVEELYLLKCSLFTNESLLFQDPCDIALWSSWVNEYPELTTVHNHRTLSAPCFSIFLEDFPLFISVQYSTSVTIKGDGITRSEQEQWQSIIKERMEDVRESEYVSWLESSFILQFILT
jgi:hypothetical protein